MTEPIVPLARLLAMSYRWMIDQLHDRLVASGWNGIRPAYGFVLLAVRNEPITPTALATRLGVSKQAASKLADAMVTAGLINRDPADGDGRQRLLSLGSVGRKLLHDVEQIYEELEAGWAALVGHNEVTSLRETLTEITLTVNNGRYPDLRPDDLE